MDVFVALSVFVNTNQSTIHAQAKANAPLMLIATFEKTFPTSYTAGHFRAVSTIKQFPKAFARAKQTTILLFQNTAPPSRDAVNRGAASSHHCHFPSTRLEPQKHSRRSSFYNSQRVVWDC